MVEAELQYKHSAFALSVIDNIRRGTYKVGCRIPAERELGVRFSVSRNTVREGLAGLLDAGIIIRQGRGAFVAPEALRIIENGSATGTARILILMNFIMYENPIYRTVFETVRSGLSDRAVCEVIFSDRLPGACYEQIRPDDIVLVFGEDYEERALFEIDRLSRGVILINTHHNFLNCIEPDNYAAGRSVGAYLYENGHRRVGIALCRPDYANEFGDRYRGVRDFFHEHGGQLLVEAVDERQDEFSIICEFLRRYREQQATAMVCFKDISALMLYEAARRAQLKLPRDMSVVGFDDRCYTASVVPALSTVRYPAEAVGRAALESIRKIFAGETLEPHRKIEPALLKRDSVRNLNVEA